MNEIYSDKLAVTSNTTPGVDSVAILLGLEIDPGYKARVLLNNEHAKQLYLILGKVLKERERVTGQTIVLTEQFYRQVGIAPEDY
ncbi:MAG: hypothetical protein U0990_06350 [Candidatus Nanopelagicales bacterium]|nr:hypothetical protein [Candidatus Nanopelagicales bacterium]